MAASIAAITTIYSNSVAQSPIKNECFEPTEFFSKGILTESCDIVDGMIVIKDSSGDIISTSIPTFSQQIEIDYHECLKSRMNADKLLREPRTRSSIEELQSRQVAIETLLLLKCE